MQLDAKPLKQAAQWVEEYRKFWEGSLDRLAGVFGKNKRTEGEGSPKKLMCPICIGNLALVAASVSSSSGLAALAFEEFLEERQTNRGRTK